VFYASLAGSHIAQVDPVTGKSTPIDPPTRNQGARRVWSDSKGNVWVSYWNAGKVGRYDPRTKTWKEWTLPGSGPTTYAVFVDDHDQVWLSDWTANALVRFDPQQEHFESFPLPSPGTGVRQILGRSGEVWLPGSGVDKLVVLRTR
jgi:virginiamycin B lyase